MNKNFYIYLIFIGIIIFLLITLNNEKNKREEALYQGKILEQNLNTNIQIKNTLQTKQDSLLNRIRFLETNVITKTDTITITKTKVDSILYTQTSDSTSFYNIYDKIHYPRFEMKIDMFLSLLNNSIIDHKLKYDYIEFPDTISVSIFFSKENKLLYSEALINSKQYKSESNMYEKVYKGIYEDFVGNNINKIEWYERIGASAGIGYNWRGEWLPYLGMGYNYNLSELKKLWK